MITLAPVVAKAVAVLLLPANAHAAPVVDVDCNTYPLAGGAVALIITFPAVATI